MEESFLPAVFSVGKLLPAVFSGGELAASSVIERRKAFCLNVRGKVLCHSCALVEFFIPFMALVCYEETTPCIE